MFCYNNEQSPLCHQRPHALKPSNTHASNSCSPELLGEVLRDGSDQSCAGIEPAHSPDEVEGEDHEHEFAGLDSTNHPMHVPAKRPADEVGRVDALLAQGILGIAMALAQLMWRACVYLSGSLTAFDDVHPLVQTPRQTRS